MNAFIYLCMYVCMYLFMYVFTYLFMYVFTYLLLKINNIFTQQVKVKTFIMLQKSCRPWSLNILTIVWTLSLLTSCMALFSVKVIWLFKIFRQSFLTYPGVPGINNEQSWRLLQIISSALMYLNLYQFHNCYLNTPLPPQNGSHCIIMAA